MDTPKQMRMATPIGHKAATDRLHLSIGIPLRDSAGLQAFVDDVSNPKSPNYRKFIPPEAVGTRFGLASSSIKQVTDYLTSQGMSVRRISKNRLAILADATVAQAESAFQTRILEYSQNDPVKGKVVRFAFSTTPSVPTSISKFVTTIGGLENFMRPKAQASLTPDQLRQLYNVAPLYSSGNQGQGRTVAISNWDGYRLSNVPQEYAQFNLPTPSGGVGSNITVVSINGENGNTSNYQGEGDIDIQCALAMAPLCNLIIYDDANDSDLISVLTQESDDNLADVVSESYGWTTDGNTSYFAQVHSIHVSMSAQGITYMCAAGDSGSNGVTQYEYPDEDPEVLVIGGTSVVVDGSGNRQSEVVWNDSSGAGGGGWAQTSDVFNVLPAYQKGNGVPTNIPYRLSPDLSLDADPYTGYEIFIGGQLQDGWGGTSCASPTFAGSLADAEEALIGANWLTGTKRMGRIQDLIYSFNGNASIFYDVTSGTNGTLPDGSNSNAGPGWDTASGWGAPNLNGLVDNLLSLAVPSSLTVAPTTVIGGSNSTGTVTLDIAAPAGGEVIALSTDGPLATTPASVTVPAGQTSATFTVTTSSTSVTTPVVISAAAGGVTVTATLTVTPVGLVSLSISPTTVVGGNYSTGTVTLSGPAASGGVDLSLSSNNADAIVPQHVEVAQGNTTGTFSIGTNAVSANETATITATDGTNPQTATLTITPTNLSAFSVSPTSVIGGNSSTGTLTLNGTAGASGYVVTLKSNNTAATVPSTVTIASGSTSTTFTVNTSSVTATTTVTITATGVGTPLTTTLTLTAINATAVTVSPTSVLGGNSSTGTVTVSATVGAGGVSVALSSSSPSAIVPSTVTVPAGSTTATFTITTKPVSTNTTAQITAKLGASVNATLTVTEAVPSSLTIAPSTVVGGVGTTGTLTLNGAAGPTGDVVNVVSSGAAASVPSTVTVPAGQTSTTFSITTQAVQSSTTVTITASEGSVSVSATLTINGANLTNLTVNPTSVTGGGGSTGTVTLSQAAPSGGAVVQLTSSNSAATVPGSVTVAAGTTSASFAVTTVPVPSTTQAMITGKYNATTASGTLAILSPSVIGVTVAPAVIVGGNQALGTVMLGSPAPTGGLSVALSSNNSNATVAPAVVVPAGATSASFTIATSSVTQIIVATITASAGTSSQIAHLTVEPSGLISVALSTDSIVGGENQSVAGIVSVGAPAGSKGEVVTLKSSDTKALSVPSSVKILSGTTQVTFATKHFRVQTPTTVTITATLGGISRTTTITVEPFLVTGFAITSSNVLGGESVVETVTLNAAPGQSSGPVAVKLTSNEAKIALARGINVPIGMASSSITEKTQPVATTMTATITAAVGMSTAQATLTVVAPVLTGLTVSPATVKGSASTAVTGTVTISGPAPSGGMVVKLSSSDTAAASVPTSVTIGSGKTTASFRVSHKTVSSSTGVTLTATLNSASSTATLTVTH